MGIVMLFCGFTKVVNLNTNNMRDFTKKELETTFELLSDEVRAIKRDYVCKPDPEYGEHGMTAAEGFDLLINRINRKIKKLQKG